MPDAADIAQSHQEALEEAGAFITKQPVKWPAKGECYNCEEPLPAGASFCDADCREDHEGRERERRNRPLWK